MTANVIMNIYLAKSFLAGCESKKWGSYAEVCVMQFEDHTYQLLWSYLNPDSTLSEEVYMSDLLGLLTQQFWYLAHQSDSRHVILSCDSAQAAQVWSDLHAPHNTACAHP